MMEILYNGCYCGKEIFKRIIDNQRQPLSFAQENLEKMLFQGFSADKRINVTALSTLPVRSYPGNRQLFWPAYRRTEGYVDIKYLPFINLLILKQMFFAAGSFFETIRWCVKCRNASEKIVFSYSTNPPVLLPMLLVCKIAHIKSVVLVSEIPTYRFFGGQNSLLRKTLLKFYISLSTWLHEKFDGYVFLTNHMNDINQKRKPYKVVEGMVDTNSKRNTEADKYSIDIQRGKNIILYSGSLNQAYGLSTLIDGFNRYQNGCVELWFCGNGDYQEKIIEAGKKDERIRYLGMLPNYEVLKLQSQVAFLVNPRPSHGEYTKYSFPSKTLEYMMSGTPLISTKLKGIPEEYDNYINYIEDESEEGILEMFKDVFSNSYSQYKKKAESAKAFVIKEKNPISQCQKIIDLFYDLQERQCR